MKIIIAKTQDGIALIMVLLVIVVLGILAGKFAYSMKVETTLARNASRDPDMEWLGRSGAEYACYILGQDARANDRPFDALQECWAGGTGSPKVLPNSPVFDDAGADECLPMEHVELGPGSFSVKIVDLDRKFNVNTADDFILRQALILIGVDATTTPTIVDSIMDWRDPDHNTRPSGAESDDYLAFPNPGFQPYYAMDGPFTDMKDLLFVRGITPAIFYGNSGGDGSSWRSRYRPAMQSRFEEPVYTVGMADLFTHLSGPLVNINTASALALQVIPFIDENTANAIIQARSGPDGIPGNEDDEPFRSPQEAIGRVPAFFQYPPNRGGNPPLPGLNPAALLGKYFSVRSLVFEAHITARIDNLQREYVAIISRRDHRRIEILNFHWR